jgi:broad specificity phosphatase PhoE
VTARGPHRARRLYFIRHGETGWNAERRLQGQHDIPLNALGRRQSVHCGEILRRLLAVPDRPAATFVFAASPLNRARETMDIVRAGLGLMPHDYAVDSRLAEMSFGRWEGLTYQEVRAQDRTALAARERDKWNFCPPGGESYAQVLLRVRDWHDSIAGDAIVAAHGGVARVLMVIFGVKSMAEAPQGDVGQGVVYEFAPGMMNRYD